MKSSVSRSAIVASLPKGAFWRPKINGFFDKLLDGLGENFEKIRLFLAKLSTLREPTKTLILADLEKEFGILTSTNITEAVRREQLKAKKYRTAGNGTEDDLQDALDSAGFNVIVTQNDPAVDPAIFLNEAFGATLGNDAAHLGRVDAFFSVFGGELIVNGPIISQSKAVVVEMGGTFFIGNSGALIGGYEGVDTSLREYEVPTNPRDWPMVFFVSGTVTKDIDGFITDLEAADVPSERKSELVRIIIEIKGLHSWCALIVNFT